MISDVELSSILKPPVSERIRFVEAIWDSITEHPEAISLGDAEREELDRRFADYLRNPDAGSPWSEVKARIVSR